MDAFNVTRMQFRCTIAYNLYNRLHPLCNVVQLFVFLLGPRLFGSKQQRDGK
jgi:hypothetical protein